MVQANPQKSGKTVPMGPPQIKRLPSNNELLCHLFPYPTTEPDVSDNGFNPAFQPAGFPGFQPGFASQYMGAFASSSAPVPAQNYSDCTFN